MDVSETSRGGRRHPGGVTDGLVIGDVDRVRPGRDATWADGHATDLQAVNPREPSVAADPDTEQVCAAAHGLVQPADGAVESSSCHHGPDVGRGAAEAVLGQDGPAGADPDDGAASAGARSTSPVVTS